MKITLLVTSQLYKLLFHDVKLKTKTNVKILTLKANQLCFFFVNF